MVILLLHSAFAVSAAKISKFRNERKSHKSLQVLVMGLQTNFYSNARWMIFSPQSTSGKESFHLDSRTWAKARAAARRPELGLLLQLKRGHGWSQTVGVEVLWERPGGSGKETAQPVPPWIATLCTVYLQLWPWPGQAWRCHLCLCLTGLLPTSLEPKPEPPQKVRRGGGGRGQV